MAEKAGKAEKADKKAHPVGNTVGSVIDSYCNKCKNILPHTILTMKGDAVGKVSCNTCKASHKYQPTRPPDKTEQAKARQAAAAARRAEMRKASFDEALAQFNLNDARLYNLSEGGYQVNDLIKHNMFGYGIVEEVEDGNKMTIRFREGNRRLVFNYHA